MQLQTTRFGPIEIDDAAVITFTQPIIGFQNTRRFVLLPGPEGSSVKWLQSTELGDLAFLIMDPRTVVPDYHIELNDVVTSELAVDSVDDLEIYTLLVVPKDPSQVRTNLKAPVLINPKQRLARQLVLERSSYPIQFYLAQARPSGGSEEVVHARADS